MADDQWPGLIEPAEHLALQLTRGGLQRMPARVLAVLLFSPTPTITAGEVAEVLSASPGTISTTIRVLERSGLVERVPVPGSRREHYRVPDDGWVRLMSSQNEVLGSMADAARIALDRVDADTAPGRRLGAMARFYDRLRVELPALLRQWEAEERAPDPS